MTAQQIDRITLPERQTFFKNYVNVSKPVVITGLFSDDPVGSIRCRADAIEAFGAARLDIGSEYIKAHSSGKPRQTVPMTLGEYLARSADDNSGELCTEQETPARILCSFRLPEICRIDTSAKHEIFNLPRRYGDHDLASNIFVASAGNVANLHYDGDQRQVFLYQVFGNKEVILFPPKAGVTLRTCELMSGMSGLSLSEMDPIELDELVDKADGYRFVIHPGEAVYIPMLMWHYLRYIDDGMSFNLRFGRNEFGRILCAEHFHRDYYIQNVASTLAGERSQLDSAAAEIGALLEEYPRPVAGLREKLERIRHISKQVCRRVCPEADVSGYDTPGRDNRDLERLAQELHGTLNYAPPEVLSQMRLSGACSPAQRERIAEAARKCGYTQSTLEHLVASKLGKRAIGELSRTEASSLLLYMNSTGARW